MLKSEGIVIASQEIFAGGEEVGADPDESFGGRIEEDGIDLLVESALVFHDLVFFVDLLHLVGHAFVVVKVEPLK